MANMAMAKIQPGESAIEAATRQHGKLFAAYIVVLVLTALVVALFTWLVWNSGNKVQDAVREDADARIEEAKEEAAEANKRAAEATRDVATLQLEVAKQQERAAKAEFALLGLQGRLAHRRISPSQHKRLVSLLKPSAGSAVNLTKLGDDEAAQFADDIISVLHDAGWIVNLSFVGSISPPRYGLQCFVDESSAAGKSLASMCRELPTSNVQAAPRQQLIGDIMVGLRQAP